MKQAFLNFMKTDIRFNYIATDKDLDEDEIFDKGREEMEKALTAVDLLDTNIYTFAIIGHLVITKRIDLENTQYIYSVHNALEPKKVLCESNRAIDVIDYVLGINQ